jgi:hypothetical protein
MFKIRKIAFQMLSILILINYFLFPLSVIIQDLNGLNPGNVFLLFLIMGLLIYRSRKKEKIYFIPDIFLFSLPLFWATNLGYLPGRDAKIPLLLLTAFLFCIPVLFKKVASSGNEKLLIPGVFLSCLFLLIFSGLLNFFFSGFTKELLNSNLINLGIFLIALAIGKAASRIYTGFA